MCWKETVKIWSHLESEQKTMKKPSENRRNCFFVFDVVWSKHRSKIKRRETSRKCVKNNTYFQCCVASNFAVSFILASFSPERIEVVVRTHSSVQVNPICKKINEMTSVRVRADVPRSIKMTCISLYGNPFLNWFDSWHMKLHLRKVFFSVFRSTEHMLDTSLSSRRQRKISSSNCFLFFAFIMFTRRQSIEFVWTFFGTSGRKSPCQIGVNGRFSSVLSLPNPFFLPFSSFLSSIVALCRTRNVEHTHTSSSWWINSERLTAKKRQQKNRI